MQEKKFKEIFDTIPSPDDLSSLGVEGLKAEVILVDMEKDKKLSMLKQLSAALVKSPNSNPASIIKKIAGLVSTFSVLTHMLKHRINETLILSCFYNIFWT